MLLVSMVEKVQQDAENPESGKVRTTSPSGLFSLYGLNLEELSEWLTELGQPSYRAKQIMEWLYEKRCVDFEEMSNLPAELREHLAEQFTLSTLSCVEAQGSEDRTRKFLFKLHDGRFIETVLIPATTGRGGKTSQRRTLCVSSQVGCAYDCKFCASGLAGLTRNLESSEIIEQLLLAESISGKKVDNIVFMGMGEPLANFKNLKKALEILNAQWGIGIGARQITVSTSGVAPVIEKLAELPMQLRLAISLHGATDEVRSQIMPVNDKYPLDRLFAALEVWQSNKKQKVTLEYIFIEGVNDSLEQAQALKKRAASIRAKVNLIPYNTVEGLPWTRPSEAVQERFCRVLIDGGVPATIRREKGHDIDAACGQLRLKREASVS